MNRRETAEQEEEDKLEPHRASPKKDPARTFAYRLAKLVQAWRHCQHRATRMTRAEFQYTGKRNFCRWMSIGVGVVRPTSGGQRALVKSSLAPRNTARHPDLRVSCVAWVLAFKYNARRCWPIGGLLNAAPD